MLMQEIKNITTYRQSLRERIVETAMKMFAMKGIRAVKMDDIAQQLSISKRTLYEIYENKEVLLFEGVKRYKALKDAENRQMMDACPTVMDMILKLYEKRVAEFKQTSPLFYSDLEKYPRVLGFLEKDRNEQHRQFLDFLLRGVNEGYFRSDLDYELVSQLFSAMTHHVITAQLYSEHSLEHIIHNLVFVTLRGICTQKGIEILDEFVSIVREK